MNESEIRARFQDLTVWKRGSQRAPHKPLLLLYALGRYDRGEARVIPYAEIDPALKRLLFEFGPPRKAYHPEYPFWRLQNDDVWEVEGAGAGVVREGSGDARRSELLNREVTGGVTAGIYEAVRDDRRLLRELANTLLDAHFPSTLHGEILEAVGLGEPAGSERIPRDPAFRDNVLTAYERRCAVCSFDLRVGDVLIALEAAHIKWHQAGGPSEVPNGLALCSMHHKLLDRGAFSVTGERRVVVSERVSGSRGLDEWLLRFHGRELRAPVNSGYRPGEGYLAWHRREVFRGPGRG